MSAVPRTYLTLWLLLAILTVVESTTTTINTTLGMVSGDTSIHQGVNISIFYGIPYAKPPVGNLRFKPPVPADAWTDVKNASKLPNSCWQVRDTSFNLSYSVKVFVANTELSEDCLYLNIWIPETTKGPKAVMVWIYGGGFWGGTSTVDLYNGATLAARNNVIVVSFNYRVGPLGFLYCGTDDCPGNVGLLDQALALKWVKDNAVMIGGDPSRITIFGESAGAVSVGMHLMSPMTRDLFTNAILMSSSANVPWGVQSYNEAQRRTQGLANLLNPAMKSLTEAVNYLKTANASLLTSAQWNFKKYYFDLPFAPVIDGKFLTRDPITLGDVQQTKNASILIGVVKNECTYFLLYGFPTIFGNRDPNPVNSSQFDTVVKGLLDPLGSNFTTDSVKDFVKGEYYDTLPPWARGSYLEATDKVCGDLIIKCPAVNFAEFYSSQVKGHVYMYSYEHRVSTSTWPKWVGATHGYDLELFFGHPWAMYSNYTDEERKLSDDLMIRISNFAKTGDPNTGGKSPLGVKWPEYTAEDQNYLVMDTNQIRVDQSLRYTQCQFWNTQIPILQKASVPKDQCPASTGSSVQWGIMVLILSYIVNFIINNK